MIRPRIAAVAGVTAAALAALPVWSCRDEGAHVYVGRLFLESRDCLGTPSSVDVVAGDDPGTCDAVCLVQPRADGGRAVYVSVMCAPYPAPDFDVSGQDPICARALNALTRDDTCLSDGGTTHPIPRVSDAAPD